MINYENVTEAFIELSSRDTKESNKLGYDNFDGLLISNFAGDIASFRFYKFMF